MTVGALFDEVTTLGRNPSGSSHVMEIERKVTEELWVVTYGGDDGQGETVEAAFASLLNSVRSRLKSHAEALESEARLLRQRLVKAGDR